MLLFSEYAPEAYFDMLDSLCCLSCMALTVSYGSIRARYDTTLCSCQGEQHVLKAAWSKRGGNVLLRARFWVALLKSSLCSCNGFAEAFSRFLTEDFFFFWRPFSHVYSFTYFKVLSACLLILGAEFSSAWCTGDLKIQILHRIGWSQPFPLSYAYKIVVVTGLPAFINVSSAWICACAVTLSPAKMTTTNDALGYSQLPWEGFKIWVKHETVTHPSWVSLF